MNGAWPGLQITTPASPCTIARSVGLARFFGWLWQSAALRLTENNTCS